MQTIASSGCASWRLATCFRKVATASSGTRYAPLSSSRCVAPTVWVASRARPARDAEEAPSAGRRYLEAKQRARRLAEEQAAQKAQWADESHRRLAAVAEVARANPIPPPELSGRDAEMFLNGAYLVPAEREGAFRNVLTELGDELGPSGVAYELTGPWPPYNFVGDPQ